MNDASIAQTFPNESDPQIIYTYVVYMYMYNEADPSCIHVDGAYNSMWQFLY